MYSTVVHRRLKCRYSPNGHTVGIQYCRPSVYKCKCFVGVSTNVSLFMCLQMFNAFPFDLSNKMSLNFPLLTCLQCQSVYKNYYKCLSAHLTTNAGVSVYLSLNFPLLLGTLSIKYRNIERRTGTEILDN